MRHLGSLLLALVIAPLGWLLTGTGLVLFNHGLVLRRPFDMDVYAGLLALIVAGLLFAVPLLVRLAPVGPAVIAVSYLGLTAWGALGDSFHELLPESVLGVEGALTVPANGTAALIAVPLLLTIVQPQRWRPAARPPVGGAAPGAGFGGPVPPGGHPPNYGPALAPQHPATAAPAHVPTVPPNYGPLVPAPHQPAAVPPPNAPWPSAPRPASTPPPNTGWAPPAPAQPAAVPSVVPSAPGTATRPWSAPPGADETTQITGADETTQVTGHPDPADDGTTEITRRMDDTGPR